MCGICSDLLSHSYARCQRQLSVKLIVDYYDFEDVASKANKRTILEDIGCNADLYVANQEENTQI